MATSSCCGDSSGSGSIWPRRRRATVYRPLGLRRHSLRYLTIPACIAAAVVGLSAKHCTALPVEQWLTGRPRPIDHTSATACAHCACYQQAQYVSTHSTYVVHALWHYLVTYLVATQELTVRYARTQVGREGGREGGSARPEPACAACTCLSTVPTAVVW